VRAADINYQDAMWLRLRPCVARCHCRVPADEFKVNR
jgi:hypothetical protein